MGKHVLVVGGGVVGMCTAYYAAQKGHRVTLLDRGTAEDGGCSYGNAGMIVPSHFTPLAAPGMIALGLRCMWNPESPFYIRPRASSELWGWVYRFFRAANADHVTRAAPVLRDLHLASRSCFEAIAEADGEGFGLTTNGLLMLCKTEQAMEEEGRTAEQAQKLGIPAEVLTASETARRDPDVSMDIAGSVYFPLDCHLTPGRLMASLRRHLLETGVDVVWGAEVTGFRALGTRVEAVCTRQGDMTADEYVVCAGAWSTDMVRDTGVSLPMQAGKGYSLTLSEPRQLPRICAILTEARVAVTPMGSALRFGGTMELTGVDSSVDSRRVRGIVRSVTQYYPAFTEGDFRDVPVFAGLRPCSPDGLPYVGRFTRYENLSTATGHSMLGVSLGPISGKLMAEILSGESPSIDIALLRPDRYA